MKRTRLLLSSLCLAIALTLTCVPTAHVYADGGPQGGSNSTQAPPPPPPSTSDLIKLLLWLISLIS